LSSLTFSQETVCPSRNSRAERSRCRTSSSALEPSISSRNDSIDSCAISSSERARLASPPNDAATESRIGSASGVNWNCRTAISVV
jgi:hypothetical protein